MILFIKPHDTECAFVRVFDKEGNVYIDNAFIIDIKSLHSIFNIEISNRNDIDIIQYEASIYVNDGFDLRKYTDIPMLMYRSKNRFKERITPEMENVKSFIFRATQSNEYSFFMDRFSSYQLQDDYNICVDTLCDISRYYRMQKRLN